MLTTTLEAILFAAAKPLDFKILIKTLNTNQETLREAIDSLKAVRNIETSGIHLLEQEGKLQLVSNPAAAEAVKLFAKEDMGGELTKPSLETLTIIAYRGPMTKPEIEQIRGVNCTMILRNLLMRGLVEEKEDVSKLQPVYSVSLDLLRHLGIVGVSELPEYADFHNNAQIDQMIQDLTGAIVISEEKQIV
ncbi:MAG: Segregation and condensation protein B [Candidatus Uhrbacteria bacterium GW2011_GWE2_45_35]|uniref:Segregation and condensation protein B n=2 Tax=Candidatus Uhriibacteriota TaxID=1752732 RepID=A0A0G1JCI3_9BACT|nr:MAG: Segregation and condensation protein B [Candidatus Uhrbacteria bacterium GW2011_GWF2_44_350]KKU06259.1 MAG: Segregation and condensation protein B [Candidatus Uhrbacteria bacterium GW2011_GWE2_45_35]HBR80453.1 SMC-Scp complex subunit ScpB [Candidatus Uhrbacteria bacterium]HCU31316.1 SMC-Scp complex subunit ScpB [Candidatus Uhrbacteria bacterium]